MMNKIFVHDDIVALNSKHRSIAKVTELGTLVTVSKGDLLYRQGELAKDTIFVTNGSIHTFEFDDALEMESNHRLYKSGQLLTSVASHGQHHCVSARALEESTVCLLSQETTEALMSGTVAQSKYFFQMMRDTLNAQTQTAIDVRNYEESSPVLDAIIDRSVQAQSSLFELPEAELDELIFDIADQINRQAWQLAAQAIAESGMGKLEHRVQKIMLGSLEVAASLKDQPGVGSLTLEGDEVEQMLTSMGVILGLIPITNPVETLVFKVLIALKSRNSIVLSCHRNAKNVSLETVSIIHQVLTQYGINSDVVLLPDLPIGRKVTQLLMRHKGVNFILATGGEGVVQESYRSGTPSIGVGKGNAPVWIREDANINQAAAMIVESKAFDNGVVCGSENNLIVSEAIASDFCESLIANNAAVLAEHEVQQLLGHCFDTKGIQRDWLGKSAAAIAEHCDIERDYPIELLVCPIEVDQLDSLFLCEKLAPILSLLQVNTDQQALSIAQAILASEGRGHTAIVHSQNREAVEAYTKAVDVSRVLVNSPGTQGCIGACNGLKLSWTLGCGTAGGGSTSDNVTYEHLMNKKRLAFGHIKSEE
ncbi:aldehyde dehydrogenase family protein [Reinekea marina]|uniref:Aldehyde dehydrogenase family protein n=1 Tax=Reinekea marina TaxID=1310421 RepID=A0ABV7WX47_9GAMM|nr:aldehyde dehydrogenase family protein [Reinekea marina]MDN3647502.1 aldehyde dehydrogenase family protein [Reinekea marina]